MFERCERFAGPCSGQGGDGAGAPRGGERHAPRGGLRRAPGRRRRAAGLLVLMALAACDPSGPNGSGGAPAGGAAAAPVDEQRADVLRAQAASLFAAARFEPAAEALAPLVERPAADGEDLLRAAAVAVANADPMDPLAHMQRARALLDRAEERRPDDPALDYLRGHLAMDDLDYEAAAGHYERVLERAPQSSETRYLLAEVYEQLGRTAETEALLQAIRERGVEHGGSLYATATFMLSRISIRQSRDDPDMLARGEALQAEHKLLDAQGIQSTDTRAVRRSSFGACKPPDPPGPVAAAAPRPAPVFEAGSLADGMGLAFNRPFIVGPDEETAWLVARHPTTPGSSAGTFALLRPEQGGGWQASDITVPEPWPGLISAAGDVDDSTLGDQDGPGTGLHHPAEELLFILGSKSGGTIRLLAFDDGLTALQEVAHGIDTADVRDALFTDFDHDGDLDIVLGCASGVQIWRNDGAEERLARRFTLVPDAVPPGLILARGLVAEDFDSDQDVDLLVVHGGEDTVTALANLRGGRFEDVTEDFGLDGLAHVLHIRVADLDQDGRPDLVAQVLAANVDVFGNADPEVAANPADHGLFWHRNLGDRFEQGVRLPLPDAHYWVMHTTDIDLDGLVDLLALESPYSNADRSRLYLLRGPVPASGDAVLLNEGLAYDIVSIAVDDVDGDLDPDLVVSVMDDKNASGVQALLNTGPIGHGMRYVLRGRKDNTHGVGAILEARAGEAYRRIWWDGSPQILGCGDGDEPDYVIVTWPNGVVQYDPHLDTKDNDPFTQPEGAAGSCPFLYTWNGETYEFVFDVLGATPLGLPMAPGRLVPFNHHEYSKIEGQKLVPDEDGRLRIALTEELREVTYLDRAQLIAVDHPAGVEVQPNEAFRLPPFPEHHLHTLRNVVPVPRVLFRQGRGAEAHGPGQDVTALTAALDRCEARPWTPLPSQFPGIAEPWSLELVLAETDEQRAALAAAPKLRLVLTGWLQWAEASTNMALAHHPVHRFELPSLSVPDADAPGGWRLVEPPIGFPAGKTRTQVVDVTGLVDPSDPRLLFTTTQRLSWDRIALALDADDAPVVRTPLEPVASRVTFRGFSRRLFETQCVGPAPDAVGAPAEATALKADLVATAQERFDWDELDMPRWNQHPGRYTRYGEVTPLLTTTDDMYVIFGAGDAVFVEFDGRALPPLQQGWTRDWLLYLDGWAKDRDPNTLAAETVEPLPFHGMSSYPPPPGESYPDTPAHRAYREVWNTRPGRTLIVPLAARR